MKLFLAGILLFASPLLAQNQSDSPKSTDPWKALSFLKGAWEAKTQGGSAGASGAGTYTFQMELGGHVLARHSGTSSDCKGPADFNCEHADLLYVYQNANGAPLEAIYFDSEGHVIHYHVTTPDSHTAVFESDASAPGPQFRLVYELKDTIMLGRFQIRMPGQAEWKSYLEWSGAKL